jgi:hypothetical protein
MDTVVALWLMSHALFAQQTPQAPPSSQADKGMKQAATGPAAAPKPAFPVLVDKTLVAWVSPANLIQRGGSVLTLDDQQSHFDGIVFGELLPAKWMAGSDFFGRTQRTQANYPAETAGPRTLVQMAIVYKGNHITVYRDGTEYARHKISQPQTFDADNAVVMGLRHIEATDPACFAGTIDDARIYNIALSARKRVVRIELTRSSLNKGVKYKTFVMTGVANPDVTAQEAHFELNPGETLDLRIYLDKTLLEVFANGRQCLTQRIYPTRQDSLGVALFCTGGDAIFNSVDAWEMAPTGFER